VNQPWHEWAGLFGVALILIAFLLLQLLRLHGTGPVYQAMNALGALGVLLSLAFGTFNLPAFVMELAWLVISLYGMAVGWRRRRTGLNRR
jgi:hypothetical protein